MMARAFQKMTETPRNCYKADFDEGQGGGRGLWFCNVASQVMIAYPINGGPMQSLLKLTLEWDRPTDQGKYKCDEITQSNTIRDWVSQPFLNDYYLLWQETGCVQEGDRQASQLERRQDCSVHFLPLEPLLQYSHRAQ